MEAEPKDAAEQSPERPHEIHNPHCLWPITFVEFDESSLDKGDRKADACAIASSQSGNIGWANKRRMEFAEQSKSLTHFPLEHVSEKLIDFSDKNMLQFLDFERVLIDRMIPSDRSAL